MSWHRHVPESVCHPNNLWHTQLHQLPHNNQIASVGICPAAHTCPSRVPEVQSVSACVYINCSCWWLRSCLWYGCPSVGLTLHLLQCVWRVSRHRAAGSFRFRASCLPNFLGNKQPGHRCRSYVGHISLIGLGSSSSLVGLRCRLLCVLPTGPSGPSYCTSFLSSLMKGLL